MNVSKVLMVEGADDQHVIWSLLKKHDFPEVFVVEEKGGVEKLLTVFPVQIKVSNITAVGVVIDADTNIAARWASLRSKIEAAGYNGCPLTPPSSGLVLEQVGLPRLGAWLMPDNSLPGMLEDFVSYLVPPEDSLWPHCIEVIDNMPAAIKEFSDAHQCKARIHTWLAWKADPGTPMGLAITKNYLKADSEAADGFIGWLRQLFLN